MVHALIVRVSRQCVHNAPPQALVQHVQADTTYIIQKIVRAAASGALLAAQHAVEDAKNAGTTTD